MSVGRVRGERRVYPEGRPGELRGGLELRVVGGRSAVPRGKQLLGRRLLPLAHPERRRAVLLHDFRKIRVAIRQESNALSEDVFVQNDL